MIDLKWFVGTDAQSGQAHAEMYRQDLIHRGESGDQVDQLLTLNEKRKAAILAFEQNKSKQNKASQKFAMAKKAGEDTAALLEELQDFSKKVKEFEKQSQQVQEEIKNLLDHLPNRLDEGTPIGACEKENMVYRSYGEQPSLSFEAKEHWELGEASGTIDFERAGKVSGARFAFLRKGGARLERALIQFMLDKQVEQNGYEEVQPPLMVGAQALYGTGNFPKFKADVFKVEDKDGYLIPTAEVPLTNLYAQEVLDEKDLPKKFAAYTPCFRSEAGSYGKDTKGLIRQHQFNKIEVVKLTHPDTSSEEHEKLLADAESILKDLELHYEVVTLCSGDISFGASKCYDINVWLPGQKAYREISSCSNFKDFQARRANIRFKSEGSKKPQFVHTLNGSGLAVGRTLVAIYENYQQEDGSILVPKALHKYMGGCTVIPSQNN